MIRKASDPKTWASALVIFLAGTTSFLSSPNWSLALLITIVCAVLVCQFFLIVGCRNGETQCREKLSEAHRTIAFLYVLAEASNQGHHHIPPLARFLGPRATDLLSEARALMRLEDSRHAGFTPRPRRRP